MIDASHPHVVPRNIVRSWLAAAITALVAMGVVVATPHTASAAPAPVGLGTAANFAVLAGAGVTNTGPTVLTGDLGTTPTPAVTGFPPGTVVGAIHRADALAAQAQNDLTTAYNDTAGRIPNVTLPTAQLGGLILTPGVYNSTPGTLQITGNLTLDALGDPNAVFIFQAGSTLTTASASTVTLTGGAQACNVFWQVGSSATLGTNSSFVGNILALTSITVTTNVTVNGRTLARNGAVTLDSDTITRSACQGRSTTTALTSSDASGQASPITFTATVTSSGGPVTTGSVLFTSDGARLGVAQLDANGRATLTVTSLPEGVHEIVAIFLGTAELDSSLSPALSQRGGPANSSPMEVKKESGSSPAKVKEEEREERKEREDVKKKIGDVNHAKAGTHKRKEWDRRHHHKDHGRLVTVQTLHTIEGVIGEHGHGRHHSHHHSWSSQNPGHHHGHLKGQKFHKVHKQPRSYVHHKKHSKKRAPVGRRRLT